MKKSLMALAVCTLGASSLFSESLAPVGSPTPERITGIAIPGFTPPTGGEHPRLYLRKTDIPELRAAAKTERGREVIQGLLNLVDGGAKVGAPVLQKEGREPHAFAAARIFDSSVYATLYQITGESRYADLSRQAIERYYQPEYSENYKASYSKDGWSYGWPLNFSVAEIISYDLCHDEWSPEFRKQVAERLGRMGATLAARPDSEEPFNPVESLASAKPWSIGEIHEGESIPKNGFLHLGYKGMGLPRSIFVSQVLLLGLRGDPEAPEIPWDQLLAKARDRFERLVPAAFGEHGRHKQFKMWGWMISGEFQLDDSLIAWRNAGGVDYTQNERVRWINLQWVSELLQREDGGYWIRRHEGASFNQRYAYPPHTDRWNNFSNSLALLSGKEMGAMLWSWNHTIRPGFASQPPEVRWDFKGKPYKALSTLLHWPEDKLEVHPAEIMPRPYVDQETGSVVFRNRWQDGNDVVIDCWCGSADDWRNAVVLWARGKRTTLGFLGVSRPELGIVMPQPSYQDVAGMKAWHDESGRKGAESKKAGPSKLVVAPEPSKDGSGTATYSYGNAIAVDFSFGGGVDVLVAMAGPGVDGLPDSGGVIRPGLRTERWNEDFGPLASDNILNVGNRKVRITTIGEGPHPKPKIDGDTVIVGRRTVSFTDIGLKIN